MLNTAIGLALAFLGGLLAWHGYRVRSRLKRELDLRSQELKEAVEQTDKLKRTDALTGLWNRRAFEEVVDNELARAMRNHQPLTIALADIDRFRALNDRLGHQAGDEVLRALSDRFRTVLRRTDAVCRWGGEQFLCLLPDVDPAAARQAMERVRLQVAENPVQVGGESISITLTFGIAPVGDDLDAAVHAADAAMQEGKRKGRDKIVVAGLPTT